MSNRQPFSHMKKWFIVLTLVIGLDSCEKNNMITLFDCSKPFPTDSIKTLYGGSYEMKEGVMNIHSVITSKYSGVEFLGKWDLSYCNNLVVEITNYNKSEFIPVTIHLEGPGASLSKQRSVFLERVYIPAGATQKVSIPLPSVLPDTAVEKRCTGMRHDPFYQWGSISTLDLSDVVAIAVYVNRPREEWNWALNSIKAQKGEPNKPYSWMTMSKEGFFPFIDKYGQFKHNEWPGKVHDDADMEKAYEEERADIESYSGPEGRSRFGGWLNGPKLEASGSFRVEKIDGKWWMVDPDGYLYWSHGVVRVTPSTAMTPLDDREFYFEGLPAEGTEYAEFYNTRDELLYPYYVARNIKKTYDFSAANIKRKYGENWRDVYAEMAHKRLKSWGLNTIANSSEKSICMMDRTPYTDRIELKSPDLESSYGVWWKFKDPFHPEFRENFHRQLMERKNELDDPWCLGFFVDNEIDWGEPSTLGEWTLQCPATQPAKIEMVKFLEAKYREVKTLNSTWGTNYKSWEELLNSRQKPAEKSIEDCTEFSVIMTETYFRNVHDEFKKVAPQKLYMGCRFARSNENVIRIGAKYCDVISYNIYKRNLYGFTLPEGLDIPVMIGEFHFGALDRGMFHPGLVKTANQQDRAECYADYVESALRNPNIIGTHWHQFSDQATTGRFDGENFQVGFVDVCDRPYYETVAKIREVGYRMYEIRNEK